MRSAEQVTLDFMPRQCSLSAAWTPAADAGSGAVSERASSVVMSNDGDLQNDVLQGRSSSKPCESSTESEPVLQSQDYIKFAEVSSASSSVNENECVSDGDDTDLRLCLGSFRDDHSVLRRVPFVELELLEPKEKAVTGMQGLHRTAANLAIPSGAMPPHKTGFKRAFGEARGELSPGVNMASSTYTQCQRTGKTEYQQVTISPSWSASKCTGVYATLENDKRLDQSERYNSALAELPSAKGQVVGWPPIPTYRKNVHMVLHTQPKGSGEGHSKVYVKVNMDGIPIGRKVDLNVYGSYASLMIALEEMFCIPSNGMFVLTYEDKEGDWMLVGDVPWGMFVSSVRRLRIVRGSESIGLVDKCRFQEVNVRTMRRNLQFPWLNIPTSLKRCAVDATLTTWLHSQSCHGFISRK